MRSDVPLQAVSPRLLPIEIAEVKTPSALSEFIRFPHSLYVEYPRWVPPLEAERWDFLDPRRNPWFQFGRARLFLARRDQKVVGRIAGVDDPRFCEFHHKPTGLFGMFESIDDPSVAAALFDAAAGFAQECHRETLLGPVNFSTNYECGVLVEGFATPPTVMMPYNPPYYARLYEACGFAKAKDLWAFDLPAMVPPVGPSRIANKIRARYQISIRPLQMKRLEVELKLVQDIYNAAWERNWGFVPMTPAEIIHMADELRHFLRPELVLFAEIQGEPVGFAMTLPDLNEAFAAVKNGRLTKLGIPIGLLSLTLALRRIRRVRLMAAGVKQRFRRRGIETLLYLETVKAARKLGFTGMELSWTLEDNFRVNSGAEAAGAVRYKTYRLYERTLTSTKPSGSAP